ncbi:hypothetical protein HRG_004660 [Hirsutella rhossiliensis]|uniref:Extracellular serine-rich protein n=1 Tax=Hirsutella rhossiliensis TaxID=111463 RepID=A0A9P8MZN2_9HYPO|nr:uncharacterized protein HRG_04660 [Hirsutella rhossiliensis]KAH0964232.1 hypothetical protein HRG_04660 [Hirsutella rhossiliensis]
MQYTTLKLAVLSLLAANAAAKTIRVDINGKTFSPDNVKADRGDMVEFHFSKSKHSVVAGNYDKACSPVGSGGFYSGTVQAKGDEPSVFRVNVTTTDPIFFYCSVGNHCKDGMVGAVNPSSDKTVDKFRSAAKSAGGNISPDAAFGGTLVKPSEGTAPTPSPGVTGAAGHLTTSFGALGAAAAAAAAFLA